MLAWRWRIKDSGSGGWRLEGGSSRRKHAPHIKCFAAQIDVAGPSLRSSLGARFARVDFYVGAEAPTHKDFGTCCDGSVLLLVKGPRRGGRRGYRAVRARRGLFLGGFWFAEEG